MKSDTWYSPEYGQNASRNTWFYGTVSYPSDESKEPYRTDSLSANIALTEDFYENYHRFRIEWEPPEDAGYGGYVKWFIDDKLITAVDGYDLHSTSQTEIPSEPMYLVMNLAVSKDWGFPDAWFKNCSKKCWSCLDPDCACALPKSFCAHIPTSLEIDSVRVYQPSNHRKYSVGCNPPNRPTREFIEVNKVVYKQPSEDNPLKEIAVGGGICTTNDDCGTSERGVCSRNATCFCVSNWTGPNCLAHGRFVYESYAPPTSRTNGFKWTFFLALLLSVIIVVQWKTRTWDKSEKHMFEVLASISPEDLETPRESHVPFESYQRGRTTPP